MVSLPLHHVFGNICYFAKFIHGYLVGDNDTHPTSEFSADLDYALPSLSSQPGGLGKCVSLLNINWDSPEVEFFTQSHILPFFCNLRESQQSHSPAWLMY